MNRCEKCGQLKSKSKEHICPTEAWNKGKDMSVETKGKISESKKGTIPWNIGTKGLMNTWNKGAKGLQKAWNKGIHVNLNPKGSFKKGVNTKENNVNWKGGVTSKREQERKRTDMKEWRKACFERDNYTCQKYGVRTGGLTVHHINNFSEYPELQTDINNGITLSKKAHKEFHDKYGYTNNNLEQLQEFIIITIKKVA